MADSFSLPKECHKNLDPSFKMADSFSLPKESNKKLDPSYKMDLDSWYFLEGSYTFLSK